jgi:hypothetical protein
MPSLSSPAAANRLPYFASLFYAFARYSFALPLFALTDLPSFWGRETDVG